MPLKIIIYIFNPSNMTLEFASIFRSCQSSTVFNQLPENIKIQPISSKGHTLLTSLNRRTKLGFEKQFPQEIFQEWPRTQKEKGTSLYYNHAISYFKNRQCHKLFEALNNIEFIYYLSKHWDARTDIDALLNPLRVPQAYDIKFFSDKIIIETEPINPMLFGTNQSNLIRKKINLLYEAHGFPTQEIVELQPIFHQDFFYYIEYHSLTRMVAINFLEIYSILDHIVRNLDPFKKVCLKYFNPLTHLHLTPSTYTVFENIYLKGVLIGLSILKNQVDFIETYFEVIQLAIKRPYDKSSLILIQKISGVLHDLGCSSIEHLIDIDYNHLDPNCIFAKNSLVSINPDRPYNPLFLETSKIRSSLNGVKGLIDMPERI